MQVSVNSNCIGCGMCTQFAPGVFAIESGQAVVKPDANLNTDADAARQAAASCPVQAIEISD